MIMRRKIGMQIRAKREALGISQKQLAEMLGYKCESTISKIGNGRFSVSLDNLEKLLDKINSTLEIVDK